MGLSLVLLIAAGLMIRSFERLQAADLGFAPGNLVTATLDFPETRYRTADAIHDVESRVAERIAGIPGVRAATAVNWLPLDSTYITGDFTLRDGRPLPSDYMVLKPCVTAGYFATMGIRVLEGRTFLPSDDAASEQVVVISASMARTLWPNGNAVGQQLSFADKPGPTDWMRIVGFVDDVVRDDPASGSIPSLYRPIPQVREIFFVNHLTFVARTDGDPTAIVGAIRSAIHAVDPEQPVESIMTMDSRIRATIAEPRFRSLVLIVFSMMALGMAAVGVYGVLAYAVTERSREIGIRMALGASRATVIRATLRSAMASTLPGVAVGLPIAFAANRALGQFLFEVRPNDPLSYGVATGVLLLTAISAAAGPARRAARIDPVIAMK
jgi:putative ABC transport system permease protein